MGCTRSRRRSGSSSRASHSRRTATRERLEAAFAAVAVGAISGAVGTYAASSPAYEERVLARLGLAREPVSTQVVARDRHAALLGAIALAGAGLERLATEIRHLQRTEVLEASEPFRSGAQKGSSRDAAQAQPDHCPADQRPRRVLRANATAALEDVALRHERDISHSAVERIVLPTRRSCSTTCSTSQSR